MIEHTNTDLAKACVAARSGALGKSILIGTPAGTLRKLIRNGQALPRHNVMRLFLSASGNLDRPYEWCEIRPKAL